MRISFKTSLVCFLSIFLFHFVTDAQTFVKLNGPYGGGARVYEGRNGILFQIPQNNELYSSSDNGINWSKMPQAPGDIFLPIGLDGNLFCKKSNSVYKSSNNGQTWVSLGVLPSTYIRVFESLPDGTLLLASDNQVYQSIDNGQNWKAASKRITRLDHFYFNKLSNESFAIAEDSLFISTDKGLNWTLNCEETGLPHPEGIL